MKNFRIIYLIILLLFFHINTKAQRQANIWYFGNFAGVDFNSGFPIPLTNGKIDRWEGVASICDSLGNLLMYTDGDSVWNAQHEHMPNGFGLLGEPGSTESAIIIPYPQKDSLYFVFTVDAEGGESGLCYSVVNMNLQNGLGDIETKNVQLETPVSEKVTAVRHANNRDFWVISHGWETDSFLVYLVTPEGVNLPPQIYEIGTPHNDIGITGNNAVGYMKAAPDGSKIACVLQVNMIVELYDFDNQTGEISNPITIPADLSPYGVEFSPEVSKLYFTSRRFLFQVDLSNSEPDSIINSVTLIDSSLTGNFFGSVQLATDGKIYLAHDFNPYLGVINKPALKGDTCNFELYGLSLLGRNSRMGLPDFIQTYFLPPNFKTENYCFGDSTIFLIDDTVGIDSVFWDFGDTFSEFNNSRNFSPKHKYLTPGIYVIILNMWRNGTNYIKQKIIQINALPDVNLGNDTLICSGSSVLLNATCQYGIYVWNNFSTDSTFLANENNSYSVLVTNKYTLCSKADTINISLLPLPEFNLGNDTGFCIFDSLKLSINYPNVLFLWNNGSTDSSTYIFDEGVYSLTVTDTFTCAFSDTINIEKHNLPIFSIGNDTIICPNTSIFLLNNDFKKYLWSDSSTYEILEVTAPGIYWLQVTDTNNCKSADSIVIVKTDIPIINLGNDTTICDNNFIKLQLKTQTLDYLWNTGSTENNITVSNNGLFWVEVTNICGTSKDSIFINTEYCGDLYIPNIFTPNNDGINDYFKIKGIEKEIWVIYIYNRFGDLVFLSQDYQSNWQADNYPDGTYYYILKHSTNTELIFKGFVEVYRGEK